MFFRLKVRRYNRKLDKELKRYRKGLLLPNEYILERGMRNFDNDGNQISGKDRLFTDLFSVSLKRARPCRHTICVCHDLQRRSSEELLQYFNDRYSSVCKELLPCPFCGSEAHIKFNLKKRYNIFFDKFFN